MNDSVFPLSLRDIKRTFVQGDRRLEVLKGITLDLKPGEIVALVGQSGSGKSTLLHIAGLLERPDEGDIVVDGKSAGTAGDRERTVMRRQFLGFVYQYHHLLPEFSAIENVMLPQMLNGKSRAEARRRAAELLAMVQLKERADHRPGRLSGGEQQRVAIARAVANAPRVLLADEPTGNLDSSTADAVFRQLLGLVRETGMAALVATHNPELAVSHGPDGDAEGRGALGLATHSVTPRRSEGPFRPAGNGSLATLGMTGGGASRLTVSPRFPQDGQAIVPRGHRRFRPSQSPVRLFAHRGSEQGRRHRVACQGERDAGRRRHGSQQPVRRPGVRPVRIQGRHPADHRLRARHPPRGRHRQRAAGQDRAGRLADPAGPERDGLPQPDAAGEPRASRIQGGLAVGPAAVGAGRQHRGPAGAGRLCRQRARPAVAGRPDTRRRPISSSACSPCSTAGSISSCSAMARMPSGGSSRRCSISPTSAACRWSPPTTCTTPRPRCTRRTTCCCASSRAPTSRTPTGAG